MVPAPSPASSQPIPPNLKSLLPDRQTPWNVSSVLFNRLKAQASDQPFKLCELLTSDPEFKFILKYFEHQKPAGYSIKRIICIHNADHTQMFESSLKNIEREATNPFFAPKGKEEEPKQDRMRVLQRWEKLTLQFSPVQVKSSNSRIDSCIHAKVLPLWHGCPPDVCMSICSTGFTISGKHHYFHESATKGSSPPRDKGYFGSGIYFTNSAQYAAMYSGGGYLLLSWVSMREPYPVVNDVPHPQKGSDMLKLEGGLHYHRYNAHYIPVALAKPGTMEYYPCYKDQTPAWDEFVVFYPGQALPRFWVELSVDFPKVVLSDLGTVGELLTLLLTLLDKPEVKNNAALAQMLRAEADLLHNQAKTTLLGAEDQQFLKLVKRLQSEGETLNSATANMLLKIGASASPNSSKAVSVKASPSTLSVASLAPVLPKAPIKPALPAIAFGKELWAKYLGDVDEEPPLPPDIQQILQSPCPFFFGKKVQETHLLTLIPKTVNGKLLTLNYLEELVKYPRKGPSTLFRNKYDWNELKKQYGDQPLQNSYWALMTRDVVPGSRYEGYSVQVQLLKEISQKVKALYEMPRLLEAATSLLIEYLRTDKRLYSDNPLTYTRCQEEDKGYFYSSDHHFSVGGFAVIGLDFESSGCIFHPYGVGGLRKL